MSRGLEGLPQRELLELRLCDLAVEIEGTWIAEQRDRVVDELAAKRLRLRPHFWLSDEWFSPDGVPGVAIPFYLAHPRLRALERRQMFEVEGGTPRECRRILRHELGHAVHHAWQLQRRKRWQQTFGLSSTPYPDWYLPNPASKRFVQYLDAWYAQSHPDEDFAETFAVWLDPKSAWRKQYADWPALEKLEYVDELMHELADQKTIVKSRARPDALPTLKMTLREYYDQKREHYSVGYSDIYDRDLHRLFRDPAATGERAAAFLRRHRREIRELVVRWTGGYAFTIDHVLKDMIGRCRELQLRVDGSERQVLLDFTILLTVHSMRCVYRGRGWQRL